MLKNSVKPNHKYVKRVPIVGGGFRYVYTKHLVVKKPLPKKTWLKRYAKLSSSRVVKANLNQKAITSFSVGPNNIITAGAENLLGRHYQPAPDGSKNAYIAKIAGYATGGGGTIPDIYVYPENIVKGRAAKEARALQQLPKKLRKVHAWADANITSSVDSKRETALAIFLLKETKQRIGGGGGSSIPKDKLVELQRIKKERNLSVSAYRDLVMPLMVNTSGVMDFTADNIKSTKSGYEISYLGKAAVPHKINLRKNIPEAYAAELRNFKGFSISAKTVSRVYNKFGVTPHKERHSFAREEFLKAVLKEWGAKSFSNKTEARKFLKESFYKHISVPLGHENPSGNITTALKSYVGEDIRKAYQGLLDNFSPKLLEGASVNNDWLAVLTKLIIAADIARQGHYIKGSEVILE